MAMLLHLKRYLAHYIAAAVALLMIVAIAMAHRYSPPRPSDLVDNLVHSLHGPGFAGVAILAFAALESYRGTLANYFYAAVITLAIGVLSEAAQIPGPRDASFHDLLVDSVAILGGLGVIAIFDRELNSRLGAMARWTVAGAGMLALWVSIGPTLWYGHVITRQYWAMPTVLSFEHRWESGVYGPKRRDSLELLATPVDWPGQGNTIARAGESGRWRILLRISPYPDWSEFEKFSFVAASADGQAHRVDVSIRDIPPAGVRRGNRFNTRVVVTEKPARISFTLAEVANNRGGDPVDIAHIGSIILSAADDETDVKLLLDDFRLD